MTLPSFRTFSLPDYNSSKVQDNTSAAFSALQGQPDTPKVLLRAIVFA